MLVIKALVNMDEIGTVWIQNVQTIDDNGLCRYEIKRPAIEHPPLLHNRKDGWRKLAIKALYILEKER